jgi:hypothetical protein
MFKGTLFATFIMKSPRETPPKCNAFFSCKSIFGTLTKDSYIRKRKGL